VPAGLPSEVLAQRPDIRQAEQNLIAANAQSARPGLYFPTISLTGPSVFQRDLSNLFTGPARLWNYADQSLDRSLPGGHCRPGPTGGGRPKAALFSYELTIQTAFADAENALVARSKLVEQLKAQERLVRANSEYVVWPASSTRAAIRPIRRCSRPSSSSSLRNSMKPSTAGPLQFPGELYKAMGGGWQVAVSGTTDPPPKGQAPERSLFDEAPFFRREVGFLSRS